MRHHHLIALIIGVAAIFARADAADIAVPPRHAPADVSMQQGPANCSRWTDQCVNCSRGAEGEPPVCSNIGFACQPRAIRCLGPAVSQGEPVKR
jgi:hypothetical protein